MATATKAPAKRKAKASKPRARATTGTKDAQGRRVDKVPRKAATPGPVIEPQPQIDYNTPEWAATVEAYATLKNAGLNVPAEIAAPVEQWLAEQKAAEEAVAEQQAEQSAEIAKLDAEGPKWIRNLLSSPFNLRLQRQDKKQRIELKPRGIRGDMFPLEPGDEKDHLLRANLGYIEIIGDGTAQKVSEGQTHNIQQTNSTLAMITNELGEPIQKLTVETEYNSQGVVVAYTDPNARKNAPLGGLVRPGEAPQPEQVSQFVPTGGNPAIVSQGPLTETARLAVADKLARIKGTQGRPEEVLGLTVSVDPVRSS